MQQTHCQWVQFWPALSFRPPLGRHLILGCPSHNNNSNNKSRQYHRSQFDPHTPPPSFPYPFRTQTIRSNPFRLHLHLHLRPPSPCPSVRRWTLRRCRFSNIAIIWKFHSNQIKNWRLPFYHFLIRSQDLPQRCLLLCAFYANTMWMVWV